MGQSGRRYANTPAARGSVPAARLPIPQLDPFQQRVLELQRTAGNESVRRLLQPAASVDTLTVQRHDSFEHRLLGDATPTEMDRITGALGNAEKVHTLKQEVKRLHLWLEKAPEKVTAKDIQDRWPDVRVMTTRNGVVMTYGELNTLGDYMANPQAIDSAAPNVILPILQSVRQESYNKLSDYLNVASGTFANRSDYRRSFAKAAPSAGEEGTLAAIGEVSELNEVTSGLSTNQYQSLVARNACHFAPFNWHRWEEFHGKARDLALKAYGKNRDSELIRQAFLNNGYADHFLQDAFAAGHLINKTLVMQWFVEYIEQYNARLEAAGLEDNQVHLEHWEQIRTMTQDQQKQLSGPDLYAGPGSSTDPQTAEEKATPQERLQASGVRGKDANAQKEAYKNYLAFLNSAAVQKASGDLHNHFNEQGLWVSSPAQTKAYKVYGDASLLLHADGAQGAIITAEAAHLSQKAINDLATTGRTGIDVRMILDRFPNTIHTDKGAVLSLEDWHKELKEYCFSHLFGTFVSNLVDTLGPHMGHVSVDAAAATPGVFEWGDTMIRDWVKAQDASAIDRQPTEEKLRMLNRLLDGWVSDADVAAFEKICASVSSPSEMGEIRKAIWPRLNSLMDLGQRTRAEIALRHQPAPAPAR